MATCVWLHKNFNSWECGHLGMVTLNFYFMVMWPSVYGHIKFQHGPSGYGHMIRNLWECGPSVYGSIKYGHIKYLFHGNGATCVWSR